MILPIVLMLASSAQPHEPPRALAAGVLSAIDEAREVVVRDGEAWAALWAEHAPNGPDRPQVDFDAAMVVGVFLGSRTSTGYAVAVTGVRRDGDALVVEYEERRPPPGTLAGQMMTAPFHLVAVPVHGGEVRFERSRPPGR